MLENQPLTCMKNRYVKSTPEAFDKLTIMGYLENHNESYDYENDLCEVCEIIPTKGFDLYQTDKAERTSIKAYFYDNQFWNKPKSKR